MSVKLVLIELLFYVKKVTLLALTVRMDTKLIMCLYVIILTKKNFKNTLALIIENHLCLTNISPPHFSLKGQFQIIPKFFTFYIIRPITFYYHTKKKKKNTKLTFSLFLTQNLKFIYI